MAFKMTASSGGDFTPAPAGNHLGVCTRVIDRGTHQPPFPDARPRREVAISWEIDERMEDGRPFLCTAYLNLSMNEKATLRHWLEAWRGRAFGESEDFNIANILGKSCLVTVTHTDQGKAKVAGIGALPKGMQPMAAKGELMAFDLDDPDWRIFDQLHERTQQEISSSPEYARARNAGRPQASAAQQHPAPADYDAGEGGDPFEEDISF